MLNQGSGFKFLLFLFMLKTGIDCELELVPSIVIPIYPNQGYVFFIQPLCVERVVVET